MKKATIIPSTAAVYTVRAKYIPLNISRKHTVKNKGREDPAKGSMRRPVRRAIKPARLLAVQQRSNRVESSVIRSNDSGWDCLRYLLFISREL